MGKDGYFTHKYFSVSPDWLVLQEDSFQFKFVFTSLTFSNLPTRTNIGVTAPEHVVLFFVIVLTLCFRHQRRSDWCSSFSGPLIQQKLRPDGQLTDVLMSQLLREPFKHIGLLCCALPHTVWPHNQALQSGEMLIKSRCLCIHIEALSQSVSLSLTDAYAYMLPHTHL